MDLDAMVTPLVEKASAILDAAVPRFLEGHRAGSAVAKKGNDFATEIDLAIERQVVAALEEDTGIGAHGEEFGGTAVDSPWVWTPRRIVFFGRWSSWLVGGGGGGGGSGRPVAAG